MGKVMQMKSQRLQTAHNDEDTVAKELRIREWDVALTGMRVLVEAIQQQLPPDAIYRSMPDLIAARGGIVWWLDVKGGNPGRPHYYVDKLALSNQVRYYTPIAVAQRMAYVWPDWYVSYAIDVEWSPKRSSNDGRFWMIPKGTVLREPFDAVFGRVREPVRQPVLF
jgi:hypothetical protein